jgi:hypothetical protein
MWRSSRFKPVAVSGAAETCFLKTVTDDMNHKKMTGLQSHAYDVNHLNGSARSWFHERFALHTQESNTVHYQKRPT